MSYILEQVGVRRAATTLKNGMHAAVYSRVGAPVRIEVLADAGSMRDPLGKEGLAHFCEHILVSGSSRWKNHREIAGYLESFGAAKNASTNTHILTAEIFGGDPSFLPQLLEMMHSLLFESLFDEEMIEKERSVIHQEINRKVNNATNQNYADWRNLAFAGTAAGRPTLGTHESLDAITGDDVRVFAAEVFRTNNLAICVYGDVDPDMTFSLLEQIFGSLAVSSYRQTTLLEPLRESSRIDTHVAGLASSELMIGTRLPRAMPVEQEAALSIFMAVYGQGSGSRLFHRIRTELGLAYSLSGSFFPFNDEIIILIETTLAAEKVNQAELEIRNLIEDMAHTPVPEEEVTRTKLLINRSVRSKYEKIQDISTAMRSRELFKRSVDSFDALYAARELVSAADIQAMAKLILESPQIISVRGPQ